MDTPSTILVFAVAFYILPFFLTVVLPALLVPKFVAFLLKIQLKNTFPFTPFYWVLVAGAIFANLFWQFGLYNHVYYEWDQFLLPYSFLLGGEGPVLDGSASWIAKGWTLLDLHLVWYGVTALICLVGILVTLYVKKNDPQVKLYRKILIISSLVLLVVNFVTLSYLLNGILAIFGR